MKSVYGILHSQRENQSLIIETMPAVSIIIPVYNIGKYLEKCLDSVIAQTFPDIEIIVVNDGSTDNSPEIIARYADKDPRIVVIDKANEGLAYARNS